MQLTFFLYISLPLFCTTTTWNFQKLLSCTFYGGNVVRVLVHFFFYCHSLSSCIGGRYLFLFCHRRYKIFMLFFQQKNVSFVFSPSRSRSLSLFPSLSFAGLQPVFHFFSVFLLYSKFVDMLDNEFKLNTLDNTDTETISALNFRLYSLCLCLTRLRWLCDFPPK